MEVVAANDDDRANFASYVADRISNGWSSSDVSEYKKAVGEMMRIGSDNDKIAARQFWAAKAVERSYSSAAGVNARIRAGITQAKDEQGVAA